MSFKEWWRASYLLVIALGIVIIIFGSCFIYLVILVNQTTECKSACEEAIPNEDGIFCYDRMPEKYICCWDAKIPYNGAYQRIEVCKEVER